MKKILPTPNMEIKNNKNSSTIIALSALKSQKTVYLEIRFPGACATVILKHSSVFINKKFELGSSHDKIETNFKSRRQ